MKSFDVLVIGGGPAAITLAKNLGKEMNMALIRPEDHSMIYCAMPYAIEGLLETDKTLKSDKIVTDAGAELIRETVIGVNFEEKRVSCAGGQEFGWERLVIATGAEPILPPIPGHDLDGVTVFKSQKDMERIAAMVERGVRDAVVVGAGAIGVELAQALAAKDINTHLVDMVDAMLPNLADADMTAAAADELESAGIRLHLGRKVAGLAAAGASVAGAAGEAAGATPAAEADAEAAARDLKSGAVAASPAADPGNSSVSAVELEGGEKLPAQLVVFAVGMKPNVELFRDSGLEMLRNGIVVDGAMRTNIENVYAVGDCVSYYSGITGERAGGKLATNAVPMARVLADTLRGRPREYVGFFNGSATKAGELFVGGTGLKEAEARARYDAVVSYAEFTTTFPIMPTAKKVKLKLIADRQSGRILGGQVVSGEPVTDKVDQMTMAIQFGITARQLLGFSYSSQPWQSFYPAHNLLVKAAEGLVAKMNAGQRVAARG